MKYPYNSIALNLTIRTAWQWVPTFTYQRNLTERAKANGATLWWCNWLCFQLSYNRLL